MPRSMTSGREQTVWAKNALQSSHKIYNGQIRVGSGEKMLLEECNHGENMGKKIVSQVQEAQSVPNRINPRKHILRHSNQTDKT